LGYWYRVTISACIIAHNEEDRLPATLAALDWVDEIVVVDCGSTDGTREVAARYTDLLFDRPNLPDLNVNKNYSFSRAGSDWILCLDADEVVPVSLAAEIRRLIDSGPRENGFLLKRKNSWFGRTLMHGGQYPDLQLRLFRRGKGVFPEEHVHERLKVEGEVGTLGEPLGHFPYLSVSQYVRKMDFYTSFEARRRYGRGARFGAGSFLLALALAKVRLLRRYFFKGGFLDGWQGFAAAYLDFLSRMVVELKIRDLGREEETKDERS